MATAVTVGAAFSGAVPANAQKTQAKTIDQLRAECLEENPPGRQADRSGLISRCIQRKKAELGMKN
ncbi:hypothetical protein [Xanthobacter sp. KR7-65]|uniref:hypothetical protein n=1 Tax=Xanthobacter sp. KR7-65 TaxID=3156612 RepID=UPI0032B6130D